MQLAEAARMAGPWILPAEFVGQDTQPEALERVAVQADSKPRRSPRAQQAILGRLV